MKKIFFAILPLILFFSSATLSNAVYFNAAENLALTENLEESVFVAAQTLTINSDIDGDLYCAGQNVTINSNISGDVICAAQSIAINGQVGGSVRALGQDLEINGIVDRNVSVISQSLSISDTAIIEGDLLFTTQNTDIDGLIGRDVAGGSQSIVLSDSGAVGRNFEYYIEKTGTASIDSQSVVGEIIRHEVAAPEKNQFEKEIKKATPVLLAMKAIFSILSSILLAFFLLFFTAHRTASVTSLIKSSPVKSAFVGLAVLLGGPILIILSCLTVVGIALGAVIALFYVISLIIAFNYTAIQFGHLLGEKYKGLKKSIYLSIATSCLILGLVAQIPLVGGIVAFIAFLIGLGASFLSYLPAEK